VENDDSGVHGWALSEGVGACKAKMASP
jgi:hypothetical protein